MPRSLADCLAALAPDPSRAGFEFEQVAAWWLTADPVWASRIERVWRWAEWPGRAGGQDLGIDLVAELVDGGLLAAQVKHRAEVPTREIDSFLAAAAGGPFTERMLLATTDVIAVNGRKKLLAAGVHIVGRFELERSPVSWPDGLDVAGAGREPARGVRPHQVAAVADTVAALESGDRCRVVMACGTGKTLVAQRAAETVAGTGLVVVAVPSLSLLKQTLESWARDSLADGGLADWLAVCSDRTVADAPDPSEMPKVTTDPAAVTAWLSRRKPKSAQRVVFVTHASMPLLADALTAAARTADLLVVDEAHRVAGRGALAALATGPFPTRRRVFLTATPRIYTAQAKSKADGDGVEIVSMDDEARFGPEAHHLTFAQAVAAGLLCDFEIVVSIITDNDTARLVGNRVLAELDGIQDDAGTLASHLAVARAAHDWNATRTISFHTRINQAYWFAADHPRLAVLVNPDETVLAEATSGAVPAGARQAAIDRLRNLTDADRRLLANARVLSEGVDVPAVDAVAFIDPKRSVIDIAQAVGRAMRTDPDSGKTRGLVIVPVHLPVGADPDTAADASVWKPVWDTLRALRSIDERLAEELDRYRYQLGRRTGPTESPARLHFHSVEPLDARFVEAVTTAAVRAVTISWEESFGLLCAYVNEHGHSSVPLRHVTSDGYRLGNWVTVQRRAYKAGRVSPERQARLEAVDGWVWDTLDAAWEDGYAHLVAYIAEHGNARVPGGHVTAGGYRLGNWVIVQRRTQKAGRLPAERETRLDALDGWVWDPFDADWVDGYAHLVAYAAEHGNANISANHVTADGFALGRWVSGQRGAYKRGVMSPERRARLEAVDGWVWDTLDAAWEDGYAHLVAYTAEYGHANIPASHVTADGYQLGEWVSRQRRASKRGTLAIEHRARLEAVDGWVWDFIDTRWEDGYAHLVAYIAEHGNARVPSGHVTADGFSLGRWVGTQRQAGKAGRLATEREARLDALDGWAWVPYDAGWEDGYAHLVAYAAEHGNARVPNRYTASDGFPLGNWVGTQRRDREQGRLSPERQARLEAVDSWAWDLIDTRWEDWYARLVAYAAEHGHARVPGGHVTADGHRLGGWVANQRQRHKRGRLSPERQARLEAVDGWVWDTMDVAWEDGYAHLVTYTAEHGHSRVPGGHVTADGYRLGQWGTVQRRTRKAGRMPAGREARLDALDGWAWVIDAWEDGYAHLVAYTAEHGHARVPNDHVTADDYPLGSWVQRQRQARKRGNLTPEYGARLEALEGWVWDTIDAAWEDWYAHLVAYTAEHGHARVPQAYETSDGYRLGNWVGAQRQRRAAGRLPAEREARLEALDGWVWDTLGARWEDGYVHLVAYAAAHGHASVPGGHVTADGYRLGQWVIVQRHTRKAGRLPAEREARLDALDGWVWDTIDAAWEDGYAHLVAYTAEHGHARPPLRYATADGYLLGQWVLTQRKSRKAGRLPAEREARLDALDGWVWDTIDAAWEDGYARLVAYAAEHSHACVPKEHVTADGHLLGNWVSAQRRKYRQGKLSSDSEARLGDLPGWVWDTTDARWEDGYTRLVAYAAAYGHAHVPQAYETSDGYRLGNWVANQRQNRKRGELSADRQVRLEAVDGWVWVVRGGS